MKKLPPVLLLAFFASCSPSRYLPCPDVSKITSGGVVSPTSASEPPRVLQTGYVTWRHPMNIVDTIPSTILISAEPPAFGHSIAGYCIFKNGIHTGEHLKMWRKHYITIPQEYTIWQCKRRVK